MVDGRALHDAIAKKAALGLKSISDTWRREKKVAPFLVAWPLSDLDFRNCLPVDTEVVIDLPENNKLWKDIMDKLVDKVEPFAVLLAQQLEKEVVLILESEYGSTSWRLPISKHGPDYVLGKPSTKTDTDSIGLLWKAKMN